ncbi:hypothetical protein LTR56_027409, partial [Elasticomyces elasticus]
MSCSKYTIAVGLAALFISPVTSFIVNGWLGEQCNGAPEGSRTLGVQDGCVTDGAGVAESVTIELQSTDQEGD